MSVLSFRCKIFTPMTDALAGFRQVRYGQAQKRLQGREAVYGRIQCIPLAGGTGRHSDFLWWETHPGSDEGILRRNLKLKRGCFGGGSQNCSAACCLDSATFSPSRSNCKTGARSSCPQLERERGSNR